MVANGEQEPFATRVVVLAHPRSGSNSLVEILQMHPLVSIVNEPFNENFATWNASNPDYLARLDQGERFAALVDELFEKYTGMKELSYQLDDDCLAHLVARPEVKVLSLRRRNLLQTAVSQVVAERTGLWKTWDAPGRIEDHYRGLDPLDPDQVAGRMEWTEHELARMDAATASLREDRLLRIEYEDLYDAPGDEARALLARIWAFLGLVPCDHAAVGHYLSDVVRQARPSTYGQIPNLARIEDALGDDRTGHLPDWVRSSY